MRGALLGQALFGGLLGIIPADAGSTKSEIEASKARRDHPRGCGEHPIGGAPRCTARGSSPRMRGALGLGLVVVDTGRIIPADAGST